MKGPEVKGSQQDLVLFLISLQHVKLLVNHRERKSLKRQEVFEDGKGIPSAWSEGTDALSEKLPGSFRQTGIKEMVYLSFPVIVTSVDFLEGRWEEEKRIASLLVSVSL